MASVTAPGVPAAYCEGMSQRRIRVAILNVGEPEETETRMTEALASVHAAMGGGQFQEVDYHASISQQALLRARLRIWSEPTPQAADLILTLGGVGLAAADRMPEATREVVERELPGVPELIRLACFRQAPHVAFLRLLAGVRHHSLIVNLPGDPLSLGLALPPLLKAVPAAIRHLHTPPTNG